VNNACAKREKFLIAHTIMGQEGYFSAQHIKNICCNQGIENCTEQDVVKTINSLKENGALLRINDNYIARSR
jgi:hypothetical protein